MKKRGITILVLLAIFSLGSYAQPLLDLDKINYKAKGDMYFDDYSFDKAIVQYENINHKTTEIKRRLAQAYFNIEDYAMSEVYWEEVTKTDEYTADDVYDYAAILAMNTKYDESKKCMTKFKEMAPDDSRGRAFGQNPDAIKELMNATNKFQIIEQSASDDLQAFGATYYKDKVVFASSTKETSFIKRSWNWNKLPFLNMYIADVSDDKQLGNIEPFHPNTFAGKHHDGPASFNKAGDCMVFTRNSKRKSKDRTTKLQLFTSEFNGEKWSKPEGVYFNSREYSVGHGCLTEDGNTMYFASNMPGGIGNVDLYVTHRDSVGAKWSAPENLGANVNTEGDEMFPFIHESGLLFFASNGLPGLGGLDVFVSKSEGSDFGEPSNLGTSINGSFDDYSLIIDSALTSGFVSSNRSDGKGSDDIYCFSLAEPYVTRNIVQGTVFGNTEEPLTGVMVKIYNGRKLVDKIKTGSDGTFKFYVPDKKEYKIIATKDKFEKTEETVDTRGYKTVNTIDILMGVYNPPVVAVKWGQLAGIDAIYFNPGKANLDATDRAVLDKLIKLMNEDTELIVEMRAYTDCRGNEDENYVLSDRRVRNALTYVKKKIKKTERISGKGLGEENPVIKCVDSGRRIVPDYVKNRRIEFYGMNK